MRATQVKEDFADAYASRGALNVYSGNVGNEPAGETHFDKAICRSRDEAPQLPLIGLGCLHYGALEYDKARACFESVSKNSPIKPMAVRNILATELSKLSAIAPEAREVGMSLAIERRAGLAGEAAARSGGRFLSPCCGRSPVRGRRRVARG